MSSSQVCPHSFSRWKKPCSSEGTGRRIQTLSIVEGSTVTGRDPFDLVSNSVLVAKAPAQRDEIVMGQWLSQVQNSFPRQRFSFVFGDPVFIRFWKKTSSQWKKICSHWKKISSEGLEQFSCVKLYT